jgi:hypothetical protein
VGEREVVSEGPEGPVVEIIRKKPPVSSPDSESKDTGTTTEA